jgi:tetratricopeptide (TPR) repeat protein
MAWLSATDVGVGDGGMTAGRATRQLRKRGTDFLVALHKAEEFGLEDRRVVVSLSQLTQINVGQGKFVEAEPVYLQALKIYQTVHDEFHAEVAATLNNLGVLHRMYGQYAQAEPLLTRVLAIKEKLWASTIPMWR